MEASDAPVAAPTPSTSSQPIPRSASVSCHVSRASGGKKQKRTPLYQRSVSGHDGTVCAGLMSSLAKNTWHFNRMLLIKKKFRSCKAFGFTGSIKSVFDCLTFDHMLANHLHTVQLIYGWSSTKRASSNFECGDYFVCVYTLIYNQVSVKWIKSMNFNFTF